MQIIKVNTGYGYFKNNKNQIISKAELPRGEHKASDDVTYYDVKDKSELDLIVVENILSESDEAQRSAIEKKETVKRGLELLSENADITSVIEAVNNLIQALKDPEPVSGKPSNAVKATLYIDGKISKKGN